MTYRLLGEYPLNLVPPLVKHSFSAQLVKHVHHKVMALVILVIYIYSILVKHVTSQNHLGLAKHIWHTPIGREKGQEKLGVW